MAFLALAFLLLLAVAPVAARLLCRALGLRRPLRPGGRPAYIAVGLTPFLAAAVTYGVLWTSGASLGVAHAPVFLMVALVCGLTGLLEDMAGKKAAAAPAAAGMATAGGVLAGLGAAFLLHRGSLTGAAAAAALDALLIALGPVALWTLNARPGRALPGFLALLAAPAFIATAITLRAARFTAPTPLPDDLLWETPPSALLGPVLLAAAIEGWPEAQGRAALGAVGARLLGGVGALAAALALPLWAEGVLAGVLLALSLAGRERVAALGDRFRWLRADPKK
jgi:hypothetical protein